MRGDTLIEVLFALAIIAVVISTVTVLGISSLNNAKFSANQDQAAKYAQEGMEIARGIRNSSYAGYTAYSGTYCFGKDATSIDPSKSVSDCTDPNIDGQYIRSVTILQDDGCGKDFAHTTVKVTFSDQRCTTGTYCHSSELDSCLSTLTTVQGP